MAANRYGAGDASSDDEYEPELVAATELTAALTLPTADAVQLLRNAKLDVEGQVVDASNATLYVRAELDGVVAAAAYKPVSGEQPLWDFPDGTLAEREVAAFAVSEALGWSVVPPTVLREGPFGTGMVQLWIDVDPDIDVRWLLRSGDDSLRHVAVLDAVINNADRKGGHLLPITSGHVYGIDHGVSFNVEPKLRTVIWNWAGEELNDNELSTLGELLARFDAGLGEELGELMTQHEVRRTRRRIEQLLRAGRFPQPSRNWPPVPWPAW